MRREPGRHRIGVPQVRVQPRHWDPAKQAAADQLDQFEPGWRIFYGVGSRRFHAIALWQAPEALQVQAATVQELREAMRAAEMDSLRRSGRPWGAVGEPLGAAADAPL